MSEINNEFLKRIPLPKKLSKLFWDYNFKSLSWREDKDFIIKRILQTGDWESIKWLRKTADELAIRSWIEDHHGRGSDSRRLRYWGLYSISTIKNSTYG